MAFKLKSGNTTSFKSMGSSPAKQKSSAAMNAKVKEVKDKNFTDTNNALSKVGKEKLTREKYDTSTSSPAKQKLNKGGEGQDQDKIFNDKGNHVGNWVDGKKVMHTKKPHKAREPGKALEPHIAPERYKTTGKWVKQQPKTKKSPAKQTEGTFLKEKRTHTSRAMGDRVGLKDLRLNDKNIDLDKGGDEPVKKSGFGPRVDGSGQKELKKLKPRHPGKKAHKDGPKNQVHGVKNPGNWQPHQFKSPAKQKMEQLIPPKLKEIPKLKSMQPDYPTFKEKNPRLHERRLPSMRPINPVTPKMQSKKSPAKMCGCGKKKCSC